MTNKEKRLQNRIAMFDELHPIIQELKPEQRLKLFQIIANGKYHPFQTIETSIRGRTEKLNVMLRSDDTVVAYERLRRALEKLLISTVQAERERCAKIAAAYFQWHKPECPEYCDGDPAEDIAAKIRGVEPPPA